MPIPLYARLRKLTCNYDEQVEIHFKALHISGFLKYRKKRYLLRLLLPLIDLYPFTNPTVWAVQ
jgi:hypothetical protein